MAVSWLTSVVCLTVLVSATTLTWGRRIRNLRTFRKYLNFDDLDYPGVEKHFFTQRLDHFDPSDNRTWKQSYWERQEFHVQGGPVFLYIGAEGPESSGELVSNLDWEILARQHNAAMFSLEHRYYGRDGSPGPPYVRSVEDLAYLSSRQALADLANFITAMNRKHSLPHDTKWVVFGGSYAGNLAAWMRLKYPHLVYGAVASSAPVKAQLDFPEYLDVVRDVLQNDYPSCYNDFKKTVDTLNHLLKSEKGRRTIREKLGIDLDLYRSHRTMIADLFDSISIPFEYAVQYNGDGYSIDSLCDILTDESKGDLLDRFGMILKGFRVEYEQMKVFFQGTDDVADDVLLDPWTYQTCTEFGNYATSERADALVGDTIPLDYFLKSCLTFSETFTKSFVQEAVDNTNKYYQGLKINATRIIFVHGKSDPWHKLGLHKANNPESPVIMIKGASHCQDMESSSPSDSPFLRKAREEIAAIVHDWLEVDTYLT